MATKPKRKVGRQEFDLKGHIEQVQSLGKALLLQAARALGCTDPNDFSTADATLLDPDVFKMASTVYKDASAQIASTAKHFQVIVKADREMHREQALIDTLRETDPVLAERFLQLFEERLGSDEYEEGEE